MKSVLHVNNIPQFYETFPRTFMPLISTLSTVRLMQYPSDFPDTPSLTKPSHGPISLSNQKKLCKRLWRFHIHSMVETSYGLPLISLRIFASGALRLIIKARNVMLKSHVAEKERHETNKLFIIDTTFPTVLITTNQKWLTITTIEI